MDYVDLLKRTGKQYNRALPGFDGGFRGVDFTSNPSLVEPYRFAYLENMYKDYHTEAGSTVETFPGYRKIFSSDGASTFAGDRINGIFHYRYENTNYLIVHAGTKLYMLDEDDRDKEVSSVVPTPAGKIAVPVSVGTLADNTSRAFLANNIFYILDGTNYKYLKEENDSFSLENVAGYIPTVFSYGDRYEQRNMLTNQYKQEEHGSDGTDAVFTDITAQAATGSAYLGDNALVTTLNTTNLWSCLRDGGVNSKAKVVKLTAGSVQVKPPYNLKILVLDAKDGNITLSDTTDPDYGAEVLYVKHGTKSVTFGNFWVAPAGDSQPNYYPSKIFFDYDYSFPTIVGDDAITGADKLPPSVILDADDGGSIVVAENVKSVIGYHISDTIHFTHSRVSTNLRVSCFASTPNNTTCAMTFRIETTDGTIRDIMVVAIAKEGDDTNVTTGVQYTLNNPYSLKQFALLEPTESVESVDIDGEGAVDAFAIYNGDNVVAFCGDNTNFTISATAQNGRFSTINGHTTFVGSSADAIKKCTLWAYYDGRIFLSGNPDYPQTVFYSQRDDTGENNPAYFGVLNYFNDGTGFYKVTGLLGAGGMLMVLKEDNIYYHEGANGDDIVTRIYPSVPGNAGLGGLGACCNFLDDPVFVSKNGVDSVDKETLTLERVVGHRSGNVDRLLLQEQNLQNAEMVEWDGYMLLFVNGNVYMADSRQMFRDNIGRVQYEWYFLTGLGTYCDTITENGNTVYARYKYYATVTGTIYGTMNGNTVALQEGDEIRVTYEENNETVDKWVNITFSDTIQNVSAENASNILGCRRGNESITLGSLKYAMMDGKFYLVYETDEYMRTGAYHAAVHPCVVENRLYFGDDIGNLYCFNTDKRGVSFDGETVPPQEIHRHWYTFDGCAVNSKCATKADNCGIPHLTKKTIRKSLVIRVRIMDGSRIGLYVYTDRNPVFSFVENLTGTGANFGNTDYANLSYRPFTDAIMYSHEWEKRWVEKQFMLCDGGFQSPIGIYNLTYRFEIMGRVTS